MAQAMPVELQPVRSTTLEDSSRFVGQLEAQQSLSLQAETQGRITQIYVSSGDHVAVGEPIMQLSASRSEAELRGAVSEVRAAQAASTNALAQLDVAEADRLSAEADLHLQQEEMIRTLALVEQGALPQQDLDIAQRDITSAQAALDASVRRVNAAQALLSQSEADIGSAQAAVAAIEADLNDTLVVAPIAGQIGEIAVKVGDYVTSSTSLTTIVQNDTLDFEMAVPVEQSANLAIGLPVELLKADGEQPLTTGRISFISPQTRADSQLVQAEATFQNPDGSLQDSQRLQARIIWSEQPGILIPTDAVTRIGETTFVFVAVPGEAADGGAALVAEQRRVQLGDIQDNQYQVMSGLEPGEEIVVSGILNLSDGVPIQAKATGTHPDHASSQDPT
jgi:RND family efflux transporter MFP subunit